MTDMDTVVDNGQGLPIPVDSDPLSPGDDKTASAGAAPADPVEPVAPGSVPASDGDAAAAAAAEGGAAAVMPPPGRPSRPRRRRLPSRRRDLPRSPRFWRREAVPST